ncbi:MAG: redoxin domain-containing protein [Anaeromyxobacteraceae bacterium]
MLESRSLAVSLVALGLVAAAILPVRVVAGGEVGDVIENLELKALDGRKIAIASKKAQANVVVFFRTGQEFSEDALKALAECEREFAAKPVNWVAVVSDNEPVDLVRKLVTSTGIHMPVLIDGADAFYGRMEIRLHPYTVILDKDRRVAVREPFHKIGYCDRIRAELRFVLKEIDAAELARLEDPAAGTFRVPGGVARRHLNYGRLLLGQKKWEKALEQAEKALSEGPLAAAYTLRGLALVGLGQCDQAVAAFDSALKLEPGEGAATEGRKACGK